MKTLKGSIELIIFILLVIVPAIVLICHMVDIWNFLDSYLWDSTKSDFQGFVNNLDDPYTGRKYRFELWWINLFAFIINVLLTVTCVVILVCICLMIYTAIMIAMYKLLDSPNTKNTFN